MPSENQRKGKQCEDSWEPILHTFCQVDLERWEPILHTFCQVDLERLKQGADFKCGNDFFEIKSCRSGLTKKQIETKKRVEASGGEYSVLRCPCEEGT
jgi:hypothetical protein